MVKIGKGLALALIVVMGIANSSFLTIKPVIAQYNTPSISIVYPTNGTIVNANMGTVGIQWQYPANSTFSWVGYNLNGGGNVTVTGKDNLYDIENNGDYTFTLYANDTAGNWATPQTVTLPCPRHWRCTSSKHDSRYSRYCFNISCYNLFCPCTICGLQKASKNS